MRTRIISAVCVIAVSVAMTVAQARSITPRVPELFHTHEIADEPTIDVDPDGRVFFQAWHGPFGMTPVLVSTDQGMTWRRTADVSGAPVIVAEDGEHVLGDGDPRVVVDHDTGRLFYGAGQIGDGTCVGRLNHSDDAGATWSPKACVNGPPEWARLAVGPPPAGAPALSGYPNVVYWCAQQNSLRSDQISLTTANQDRCAASLDGGKTFEAFGAPFVHYDQAISASLRCVPGFGRPVVAPNGWLYIAIAPCKADASGTFNGHPSVTVSRDLGRSWETFTVPGHRMATEEIVPGQPTPDFKPTVAVFGDTLVVAWIDGSDNLPWLAISRDHGISWTSRRAPAPIGMGDRRLMDSGQPVLAFSGRKLALAFVGGDSLGAWRGYITATSDILAADPEMTTYEVPGILWTGGCGHTTFCGANGEFMDAVMDDHGIVYVAMVDGCSPEALNVQALGCTTTKGTGEGVVARMAV